MAILSLRSGRKLFRPTGDEKAFVDCQKILNGIPQDEENPAIQNADLGIALLQFNVGE